MNRSKNVIRSISWGLINKIIGILFPFLSRTILLYKLGNEYIGLNTLFNSILGILSLSELGIGTALIFSMYEPLAKEDTQRVCELMSLYKKCYRVIGIIVAIIGVILVPFLPYLVSGDCPNSVNIYVLYFMYLINTLITYWGVAYKRSLIIACQRVDIQSNVNSAILILQNILQFIVIFLFSDYYFYVMILPIMTLLENLLISIITDRTYPQYRAKGNMKFKEIPGVKKQIVGLLMQKVGNVVLTSADSLVISSFLGLYILGKYNNYHFIFAALFGILSIIQTSLKPIVGNSIVLESKEKNLNDFYIANFIYIWIVTWMAATMLCLYQPFIKLWAGSNSLLSNKFVLLMTISFFVYKWGDMLYVYQEATGIWWKTRYVPLMAAIVNVVINLFTVNIFGIEGITFGTIISMLLVYDLGYAKILFNEYFGKDNYHNYLISLLKYAIIAILIFVILHIICSFITLNGIIALIIYGGICFIVANGLFVLININNPLLKDVIYIVKYKICRRK